MLFIQSDNRMNVTRLIMIALSAAGCEVEEVADYICVVTPEGQRWEFPRPRQCGIGEDEEEG